MRRRQFLEGSFSAAAGVCGFVRNGATAAFNPGAENVQPEPCSESRYRSLNALLDRGAMERGWAKSVDADYQHAPQTAIETIKDLKFGIRIHWGLYCMIGSHESWGLAGANQEFWRIYNVLYQFFNPVSFDADAWMDL